MRLKRGVRFYAGELEVSFEKAKTKIRQILGNKLGCIFAEITTMAEEELPPTAQGPEVVDPTNAPVTFVDWFITGGEHEGVLNIALGTIEHSLKKPGDEWAKVITSSRLRFTREFGARLHAVLGNILGINPQNDQTSQTPPTPPKNLH